MSDEKDHLAVCMLTTSFPRHGEDTSGTFIRALAKQLAKVAAVTVIAPGDATAPAAEHIGAVRVKRFTYMRPRRWQSVAYGRGIPENLRGNPLRALQLPLFMVAFMRAALAEARTADVFHANWTPAAFAALPAARIHKIPIVVTLRGSDVRSLPGWFTRFVLRRVDRIIAIQHEAEIVENMGFATVPVQTPIDTDLFNPEIDGTAAAMDLGLDPARPIVAFVARLYPFKDPLTVAEAIPAVTRHDPTVQFVLVGAGSQLDAVRQRTKELGVSANVAIPGSRPDVNEILAASTVFLAVSPVENIWSATITEATAMGLPLILTDVGQTSSVFSDGVDCILIKPGDPDALAEAVQRLLNDADLRDRLVTNCRALHRRYGHDAGVIVDEHLKLYREAMTARS